MFWMEAESDSQAHEPEEIWLPNPQWAAWKEMVHEHRVQGSITGEGLGARGTRRGTGLRVSACPSPPSMPWPWPWPWPWASGSPRAGA